MYRKILSRPQKWDEESLALATKESLAADLLIRKARLQKWKRTLRPWNQYRMKREQRWIDIVNKELRQRMEWTVEGE